MIVAKDSLERIAEEVRYCRGCPLHKGRTHGVPGEGPADAKIVLVGEAPGREEDIQGRPFVGRAGKLLDKLLAEAGLKREELFITNVVKSRPPGNRRPAKAEIEACLPYLWRQSALIRPRVVGLLGGTVASAVLGVRNIASSRGKAIEDDYVYVVTYHPAAILRNPRLRKAGVEDLKLIARLSQT